MEVVDCLRLRTQLITANVCRVSTLFLALHAYYAAADIVAFVLSSLTTAGGVKGQSSNR
jgi:hypothetical protein